jgi:hypothetical protein
MNECRVRHCKNEVCDPDLLMCFDHVGKDTLWMLIQKLRAEMKSPITWIEGEEPVPEDEPGAQ